ncbi:hypothetical protein OSTOST_12274 [Ostertagia ostertagi]
MYSNYITDIWVKPKQLARSASFTHLTYIKEAVHDYPIKKSDSVSTLAPSLALPQYCREAQRIVHTAPVYKPHVHNWYNNSYSDTHDIINRPYRPSINYMTPLSSHVPYYTFQTRRIFFDEKMKNNASYLRESQKYLDRYVGARLKADDYANRFAYSAYEWRKPQDHAFNRHFIEAQRIVHTAPVYKPHVHNWYNNSYSVARWKDTHDIINRPYRPSINYMTPLSSHVPYYTFQTRRIFFDEKMKNNASYLRESQKYLDRYVGARLKADDYANRFAYSAYEWRKPQDHAFNRHFMYDQGVTAFTPTEILSLSTTSRHSEDSTN